MQSLPPPLNMGAPATGMPPILSDTARARMEKENAEQQAAMDLKPKDKWVYNKNLAELQMLDPSYRDGLELAKVKNFRKQFVKLVSQAGMNLKIPQWGIATAALLCHRFFSRKSMRKNDRFVIAMACLHLAAKMEESPKPIREVVKECQRVRLGRSNNDLKKALEPEELEKAKEETLLAERAVLYTLGFNLNADSPYRCLVSHLNELGLLHANTQQAGNPFKHLMQNTWNFLNDSFRSTLCLQYPPPIVCAGSLWCANEFNKKQHGSSGDIMRVVAEKKPGETFFTYFNVTPEQCYDIANQILEIFEEAKAPPARPAVTAGSGAGMMVTSRESSVTGAHIPLSPMVHTPSPFVAM